MDRTLAFYQGLPDMDVMFDQPLGGQPFDHALGGAPTGRASHSIVGNQNISLSVSNLDNTHRRVTAAGYEPE